MEKLREGYYDDTEVKTRITKAGFQLKTTSYSSLDFDQFYGWILSPFDEHKKENLGYFVVFERDVNNGGYIATIPKLQGVITEGETSEEAFKFLIDALEGWLRVAQDKGLEIPLPDGIIE